MGMEQFFIFLKFKDSGEDLDFTADKLLKSAEKIWNKLNPIQIRILEEEGEKNRREVGKKLKFYRRKDSEY